MFTITIGKQKSWGFPEDNFNHMYGYMKNNLMSGKQNMKNIQCHAIVNKTAYVIHILRASYVFKVVHP